MHARTALLALLIVMLAVLTGWAQEAPRRAARPPPASRVDDPDDLELVYSRPPDKTFTFKKAPNADGQEQELKLYVYLPKDWKAADRRPAIIFWFSGGFKGGRPKQFFPHAEYLASRGMVGMAADYRANMGIPVCVEDARAAFAWAQAHAGELGMDPAKVVAGGGSAGGYLAADLGTGAAQAAAPAGAPRILPPAALVLLNPALNTPEAEEIRLSKLPATAPAGATPSSQPRSQFNLAWPLRAQQKDCAPSILFYGTHDKFLAGGRLWVQQSRAAGVRSECFLAEDKPHGFYKLPDWAQATILEFDRFLVGQGLLTGAPTVKVGRFRLTGDPVAASAPARPRRGKRP